MDFKLERIFKGPGFAETLYLGTCGDRRIIRKTSNPDAHAFSRTALVREIRLLESLPGEITRFFPELIRTNITGISEDSLELPDVIYYDMPYYSPDDGWYTLSDALLDDSVTRKESERVFGEILDAASTYFRTDERKPAPEYADITMLRAIRESLEWAAAGDEFRELFAMRGMRLNGRILRNVHELEEYFQDTAKIREKLTPYRDRFLHGDFFPENIICNRKNGKWILLDPVSVRGIHRGDLILDLNKMDDWLSGELPALRMGQFSVTFSGKDINLEIHNHAGKLENLDRLGLSEWYRERLKGPDYENLFSVEPGWELRWLFIKAFYAFCMLPLADSRQAVARYFLALKFLNEFADKADA